MNQREANRLAAGLTAGVIRSERLSLARQAVTGREGQERVRTGLERLYEELTRRSGSVSERLDDADQLGLFEEGSDGISA